MEALVITRSIPGQDRGIGRRTLELLSVLSGSGYDVHLVSLVGPGQSRERAQDLRGLCRWAHLFEHPVRRRLQGAISYLGFGSYLLARDWHVGMAHKVAELLPQVQVAACVDAIFFDMIAAGPMAAGSLAPGHRPVMLLDLGEPMSQRMATKARQSRLPARWVLHNEVLALRRLEVIAAQTADLTLVSNDIDLQILWQRLRGGRLRVVADGIDVNEAPTAEQFAALPETVTFCGDLKIPAHQRAAVWMANQVMPLIRRERRAAVLRFVGRELPRCVQALGARPGIELVELNGNESSLRLTMLQGVAGVAPHRQPRGCADMMLLALACGRPVVATPAAATLLPGDTAMAPIRADAPAPIAEALTRLLAERTHAFRAGLRSYELVTANATWRAQWNRVGSLLAEVMPSQCRLADPASAAEPKQSSAPAPAPAEKRETLHSATRA